MKVSSNHIFFSLLAFSAMNLFFIFCFWLVPSNEMDTSIGVLGFRGFFVINNLSLLILCIATVRFDKLNEYLIDAGCRSSERFMLQVFASILIFLFFELVLIIFHEVGFNGYSISKTFSYISSLGFNKYFVAQVVFLSLTSSLLYFISNLEKRSRTLDNFISHSFGEIFKPKTVKKGFMFIDLNDSTMLGEKLGSRKYAMLLRDCFRLLNELVVFEEFEVYQYVGDEVVVTWNKSLRKGDLKAIQLFFDFKAYLIENVDHFIKNYDTIPFFKCAIHSGQVVQSEIGKKAKHLVYHGDVLNTTSRMLGECHRLGTDILVSKETLVSGKEALGKFEFDLIKNMMFKGKSSSVDAYLIYPKSSFLKTRYDELWKPYQFVNSMIRDFQLN